MYNFLTVLILGGQNTQDWPLFKSCQTIFMFPSKVDKKYALVVLCQHYTENVTRIKLGPGTYQLFLLPGVKCTCTHIRLCIQLKSAKI